MIDDLFNAGAFAAKSLRRSILRFTRRPIEYNFDRLPRFRDYVDMELAFREDFFDPPKVSAKHALPYPTYGTLLLLFLAGYSLLGLNLVLLLSGALILSMPGLFIRRGATLRSKTEVKLALVIFTVFVSGLAYVITDALPNSAIAVAVVGVPMAVCVNYVSRVFCAFATMWMYSHPCLANTERADMAIPGTRTGIMVSFLVVGLLALGSLFSAFWTLVGVYVLLMAFLCRGPVMGALLTDTNFKLREFSRTLMELVAEFFTYGGRFGYPLPGVWIFPYTLVERRRLVLLMLLLISFTFAGGTGFFFAWNTPGLRARYVEMFYSTYYTDTHAWDKLAEDVPEIDWSIIPDASRLENLQSRLKSLRELRPNASTNAQIEIDVEVNALNKELATVAPAFEKLAAAWYGQNSTSWIRMAWRNIPEYPWVAGGSLLIALANALLLPALFLLAVCQRDLLQLYKIRTQLAARCSAETTRTPWEWFVDRLRNSNHVAPDPGNPDSQIRESDHLFMGIEAENGFPVLLHRDIVGEHAYITGGSGSGKTSLGILSILVQLIRAKPPQHGSTADSMPPIVIIDLKGEYALLHTVREEVRKQAEREGRTLEDCFRLFTSEKDMATHYFNPLGDMTYPDRYVADLANLLLDALELNHGPGYGRSYYSRKNYMTLHEVLKTDAPITFDQLCDRVTKYASRDKEERYQAFELLATLYGLTEFTQLKPPVDIPDSHVISMRQVIEKRQVVYFWLPTVESSIVAREIANLALFSYFSAMRARAKTREPLRQAYLVIDEFQKLASDRFSVILQQARGFGLSAILSNQSMSDLKTPTFDLRPTVLQNTRLKLYFSFADCKEMTEFARRSGDELTYIRSGVYDHAPDGEPDAPLYNQWTHSIKPRITTNDMLRVTDHPLQAFMDVRSGAGYTQFGGSVIPLQMFHPVRWTDFQQRRDTMPWPTIDELGRESAVQSTVSPEEVDDRASEVFARLDQRIKQLDEEHPHLRFS